MAAGSWARGASTTTSRASTTFSSSPARIRSTACATDSSNRPGASTLAIRASPVGWGSASGRGASLSAASRALSRRETAPGSTPGPASAAQRQVGSAGGPVERQLGHHQQRGRKRGPLGRPPAVGPEREPADPDRPGARRQPIGLVAETPARHLRAGGDQVAEALGAAGDDLVRAAERGEREPVAIGLLPAEPAIAGEPRGEHRAARVLELHRHGDADQPPPLPRLGEQRLQRLEGGGRRDQGEPTGRVGSG